MRAVRSPPLLPCAVCRLLSAALNTLRQCFSMLFLHFVRSDCFCRFHCAAGVEDYGLVWGSQYKLNDAPNNAKAL